MLFLSNGMSPYGKTIWLSLILSDLASFNCFPKLYYNWRKLSYPVQNFSVWFIPAFVGVYAAGYILETSHSWAAVFNLTAAVAVFGWLVFVVFGTGEQIV